MFSIPRRSFKVDIAGEIFTANELTFGYVLDSLDNIDEDTVDGAILNSMPDVDPLRFSPYVKSKLYAEILKFTFPSSKITAEDRDSLAKAFNFKENELMAMSEDTLLSLRSTLEARKPRNKVAEKK